MFREKGQVPRDSQNFRAVGGGAGVAKQLAQCCDVTQAVKMVILQNWCTVGRRTASTGTLLVRRQETGPTAEVLPAEVSYKDREATKTSP